MDNICEIVRKMESDYTSGNTQLSKYVEHDMFETLNKIEAYLNSVHTSGPEDGLRRPKPFFNIVTAARNIWYRATDIDRKNIRIKADSLANYITAFAAQMKLNLWMKKARFGVFLNEWGRNLATYGSAVTKFVEKDGELHCINVPFNRIICDSVDFENNVKIEVLEYTPAQLRKQKGYDQEMVKAILEDLSPRESLSKTKKDNKSNYIKVYEVHGELSMAQYKESKGQAATEEDEDTFAQQMHVVCFTSSKPSGRGNHSKDYKDYTLYSGLEKQDPYMITSLIKEDGRTLGIGAIEHLFEAQWMVNHTAKQIKDTLDFTSLLILQTSDATLVGKNVLNSLVTGDILVYDRNNDPNGLQQLNNQHDITQISSFNAMWQNVGKEQSATPDAIRGNTQPSGTAYRLQQLITNESHSLFELMTENKGLAIEDMFRKFIGPHLKTQLDTKEELVDVLDSQGVTQFDAMYVPNEAIRRENKVKIKTVLSGQPYYGPDGTNSPEAVQKELSIQGNRRGLTPGDVTWKEAFKDFEMEVEVDPTHESEEVVEALTSLATTFQTIASLGGRPMSTDERLVFNTLMEKAGTISPLQLSNAQSQAQAQVQPQVQTQAPIGGSSPVQPTNQPMMAGMNK